MNIKCAILAVRAKCRTLLEREENRFTWKEQYGGSMQAIFAQIM